MKNLPILLLLCLCNGLYAQTNILSTNPTAFEVMVGNYDPADYLATAIINHPDDLVSGIHDRISPDSLKAYITKLSTFKNRNTGADTTSTLEGIGAARRWAYAKFQEFSAANENRLLASYLQFNQSICGMGQHRNVFAVLPGIDTSATGIILIEGHMDSRCDVLCDINCEAQGVEDNASGTALVLELARVMSTYSYSHTIVFMVTIGEEQGLFGAKAFANWAVANDLPIKAVLNNDVIGGIICGETSSAPSCPGLNHVDSTQVRLFSQGGFNSKNKQLVRFIKLQYQEELLSMVSVPMMVTVMSAEDRTGRGGDHIPFREKGFAAMRFTSANEHGNAAVGPDYHDRQHTSDDILGVDTDGDNMVDSFFVDFNYLTRNSTINGVAAAMAAIGPQTPTFDAGRSGDDIVVDINDPFNYNSYRVAVRTTTNDWDTVYTLQGSTSGNFTTASNEQFIVSVASVDSNGVESLFSNEILLMAVGVEELLENKTSANLELLQNRPNPFDETTIISFFAKEVPDYQKAQIRITDLNGRVIQTIETNIQAGVNEIWYEHGYNTVGTFMYSLVVDGEVIGTKAMVFAM
jgi:Peptidase family M28